MNEVRTQSSNLLEFFNVFCIKTLGERCKHRGFGGLLRVSPGRQPRRWLGGRLRFFGGSGAVEAVEDPFEDTAVSAVARPHEVTRFVAAEPKDDVKSCRIR